MAPGLLVWFFAWGYGGVGCHALDALWRSRSPGTGAMRRRVISASCLALAALPPLVDPQDTLMRGVVALAGAFYAFRALQTIWEPRFAPEAIHMKMAHVGMTFHDLQDCRRGLTRQERWAIAVEAAVYGLASAALAAMALAMVAVHSPNATAPRLALAYAGGGIFALASLQIFDAALRLVAAAVGMAAPPLMLRPWAAVSLADFWGARWDTAVQRALAAYVYMPLRQRVGVSRPLASLAVFAASGLVHVWPLLAAGLSPLACASMMTYFLAQWVAIMVEAALQPSPGSAPARLFAMASTMLPLPLLVEPTIALVMGGGPDDTLLSGSLSS